MTKSTITRERLQEIAEDGFLKHGESKELARMALAAMSSEPVAWRWRRGPDTRWHLASSGDLAGEVEPLYRHAQPVLEIESEPVFTLEVARADYKGQKLGNHFGFITLDAARELKEGNYQLYTAQTAPEYPETLPCPVLLEPGLRFGKGIKTSAMLAALARRAVHESDMAALSPEERVEFQARIEEFKALIAQPAPVVPQDVLEALQKVARIRLDLNDFDGDCRGIADCLGDAEEVLIEVVNRRAAMLAAAPQEVNHG